MELGTIECKALVFRSPFNGGHKLVVGRENMDYRIMSERYGWGHWKRVTGVNLEDELSRFFLMYLEESMDPPMAIVRAENLEEAVNLFTSELDWALINEADIEDYGPESPGLHFNDNGEWCDIEALKAFEINGPFMIEYDEDKQ